MQTKNISEFQRPWGFYKLYAENVPVTVKRVFIEPKQALSLQFHNHRGQLYIIQDPLFIQFSTEPVPDGLRNLEEISAFFEEHKAEGIFHPGQELWFPRRTIHRPANLHTSRVASFLEIAYGFNDERDIVRLADMYGREEW